MRYRAYIFTTEYAPGWKDMKRRPHKVISVLLLAALIAGMGMACRERSLEIRNKRWEENAETVTQNSGRIFGDEPENLYARSAVLIDADSGRVLFEKEADVIRPMASTTKIMTCIIALEYLKEHPDQTVEVSDQAVSQPKVHLGMQRGEAFYLKDLLYSLMLESHNDSAVAVAEGVAGSVEKFAEKMNAKAAEIGCKDTHFITPNGLDAKDAGGVHSTTAKDLAKIMRYCIMISTEKETFLEVTRAKEYQFQDTEKKRSFSCHNHNAFLDMMDGALSGKTGFTADAGYCYVCAEERDGKTFIVALLGSGWPDHKTYKWKDASALLTYGEKNYNYRSWWEDPEIPLIRVKNGFREDPTKRVQYIRGISDVDTEQKERQMLLADDERIVCRVNVPEMLEAPVKRRDKIGRVTFLLDGQILASYPVLAEQSVERRTFFRVLEYVSEKFFH